MLIDGINYGFEEITEFLKELKPDIAYIAIPTRPSAEKWVRPANEKTINEAFQIFAKALGSDRVEYLIGYEGNAFAFTGNVEEDLLGITSVHPCEKMLLRTFSKDQCRVNVEKLLRESLLGLNMMEIGSTWGGPRDVST